MHRRRTELGLIAVAGLVIAALYALAGLGRSATMPVDLGSFVGVVLGLGLLAHMALRWFAPDADPVVLPLVVFLNGLGQVFVTRLAPETGIADELPALQTLWTGIAVVAFIGTLVVVRRPRDLEAHRYTFGLVGLALLALPLMPVVGREINGARIWASLGPVNLQPGEFARLALAVFLAAYLVERRELLQVGTRRLGRLDVPTGRDLAPVLAAWGMSMVVLVAEKDLGSSLLYYALFVVVLWVATERVGYLLVGGGLFMGGAVAAWRTFDHVEARVSTWLDPWSVRSGAGYQLVEASLALATGGVTGAGPGTGEPDRIPEVETAFILAAIGEELGLLGATLVIGAYLLIACAGLRTAIRTDAPFDKLLAVGLTTLFGLQALVIMGGVVRLLPLTGVTLPFVSYGGSSLVANYVLVALLLRLSDRASGGRPDRPGEPATAGQETDPTGAAS